VALSKSAMHYRNNKASKDKKAAYDKELNKRPEQRAKRSELVTARRKKGVYGKGGKDLAHTAKGLVFKTPKVNRGSKKDSQGDKNARG
jgi:hypothetical protein